MRRSFLAVAAGAVMALAFAPGAGAQVGPPPTAAINITSPKPDGSQVFGAAATTSGTVHADGTGGANVLWARASLVWGKQGAPPPMPAPRSICGVAPNADPNPTPQTCTGGGADVSFTNAPLPVPAFNGPYQLVLTAHVQDGFGQPGENTNSNVKFGVEVAPATPTTLKISADKDRKVTLGWDRNTEPDMYGYLVYRLDPGQTKQGDKPTVVVTQPDAKDGNRVSAPDKPPPPAGEYTYLVQAVRPGRTADVFTSNISSPQASIKVKLPAGPAAPTTTAPPPGSGGTPFGGAPVIKGTGSNAPRLSSASAPTQSATPTSEAVTPDPGFVHDLPYGATTIPGEEEGDNPSVAINQTGGKAKSNQRGLLIPAATGAILFVAAFQLRWLKNRLEEPVTPLN